MCANRSEARGLQRADYAEPRVYVAQDAGLLTHQTFAHSVLTARDCCIACQTY
jgi:hypothetical protein